MLCAVRRGSGEDGDAVRRLWKENLSNLHGEVVDRRYRWSSLQNPAGASETVLAIDQDRGEVIGCGSTYPRTIHVAGATLSAGMPADFVVARAHRLAGVALAIQRRLIADEASRFAFFIGCPNKGALPILQRAGYKPLTATSAWVKPLRAAYKIREYVTSEWLVRIAAALVDACLTAADALRIVSRRAGRAEFVDRPDRRFDDLWRRAQHGYAVTGERTAAYLDWRYASCTTTKYRFFCLSRADSTDLLGYVAFSVQDNKIFVGDIFSLDMNDTAELLLLHFARAMRRARCHSMLVNYAGNPAFGERLRRIGFVPSDGFERKLVMVTKATTPEQEAVLLDSRNWYLFDGEMDVE